MHDYAANISSHAPVFREIAHGSAEYGRTVALRESILRQPLGLGFGREELAAEAGSRHLVCVVDGEIVGCLVLQPLGEGEVRLRQMAVRADCRGRGLGSGLVAYAETVARRDGCRRLVLHARVTAVAFYERLGYHAEGPPFTEVTIPHRTMGKQLDGKETA